MKKNIGTTDRVIRYLLAMLLLVYSLWSGSWIAFGFSIFVFYEALASWCVLYQFLGKNSCPIDKK